MGCPLKTPPGLQREGSWVSTAWAQSPSAHSPSLLQRAQEGHSSTEDMGDPPFPYPALGELSP